MTQLEANNGPQVAYWGPKEWSVEAKNTLNTLIIIQMRRHNFVPQLAVC